MIDQATARYALAYDKGGRWDDPAFGIDWPVAGVDAILSEKDRAQPGFEGLPAYVVFTG